MRTLLRNGRLPIGMILMILRGMRGEHDRGHALDVLRRRVGLGMPLLVDEVGVEVATDKARVIHDPAMEVEVGG